MKKENTTEINCKTIEKMIPGFLENDLSIEDTRLFVDHMRNCDDCNEEMEINFLLTEGIRRAENGETLDLKVELDKLLNAAGHRVELSDRIKIWVQIAAVALVFVVAAVILFNFF